MSRLWYKKFESVLRGDSQHLLDFTVRSVCRWRQSHLRCGHAEFLEPFFQTCGREQYQHAQIRLDANLRLPDIKDNLETRLILLRRRLDERCEFMRLVHAGRGQLHMEVRRKLKLQELP